MRLLPGGAALTRPTRGGVVGPVSKAPPGEGVTPADAAALPAKNHDSANASTIIPAASRNTA